MRRLPGHRCRLPDPRQGHSQALGTVKDERRQRDFVRGKLQRASNAEKAFLRLMAMDGDAGSSTSELARRAEKKQSSMTQARSSLIEKGIIYAPALGTVAFTVPGMAEYVQRLSE